MARRGYQLEHQCPQCGAPVELEESDRVFDCPYCRTRLYIHFPELGSYYFPPRFDPGNESFFVPFWRFKGARHVVKGARVQSSLMDLTRTAVPSCPDFGYTIGFRTHTITMRFVDPRMLGRFMPIELGRKQLIESLAGSPAPSVPRGASGTTRHSRQTMVWGGISRGRNPRPGRRAREMEFDERWYRPSGRTGRPIFVGEIVSLIYSPFYLDGGRLYDGITGQQVTMVEKPRELHDRLVDEPVVGTEFLPMICPECGWDLEGESDDLVLACANCRTMWCTDRQGLTRVECLCAVSSEDRPPDLFLPFWRIATAGRGASAGARAGFAAPAEMPRGIGADDGHSSPFWAPAFKVQPSRYIQYARFATLGGGDLPLAREWVEGRRYAVTLPAAEAIETAPVVLGTSRTDHPAAVMLDRATSPGPAELVFVPFYRTGHEYHQPVWGFTVHKNLLKWGRNM